MTVRSGQGLNFAISCRDLSSLVPIQSFVANLGSVPPEKLTPSLFVDGIEIFLGMKKRDLESRIAYPYFLQSLAPALGAYRICNMSKKTDAHFDTLAIVTFEDENVVWAARHLDVGDDAVSTIRALCKAVFANVPERKTTVTVRTRSMGTTSVPDMQTIDLLFDNGIIVSITSNEEGTVKPNIDEVISIWGVDK